jgi:hypothetical protein
MRIIFLDFDGVLNTPTYLDEVGYDCSIAAAVQIDTRAIDELNRLVALTGAKVVVSSTWRMYYSVEGLQQLLESRGFRGEVVGKTPELWCYRGAEIQEWLYEHLEVEQFVILDDDNDMEKLARKMVQTDPEKGLTEADVDEAVKNMLEVGWVGI